MVENALRICPTLKSGQISRGGTRIVRPGAGESESRVPRFEFFMRVRSLANGGSGRFRLLAICCRWLAKREAQASCPFPQFWLGDSSPGQSAMACHQRWLIANWKLPMEDRFELLAKNGTDDVRTNPAGLDVQILDGPAKRYSDAGVEFRPGCWLQLISSAAGVDPRQFTLWMTMLPPSIACGLAAPIASRAPRTLSYTTMPVALFQILMRNWSTAKAPTSLPSVAVTKNP